MLDAVVGTHSQAVAAEFIDLHRHQLAATSDGLIDFVTGWTQGSGDFATAWDPAFGRARLAVVPGTLDPSEVGVRLALRLTERGRPGRWSAVLSASMLRLGAIVVPDAVEVEAGGPGVVIRTASGGRVKCVRAPVSGAWSAEDIEPLPSFGPSESILLLPARALPAPASDDPQAFSGVRGVAAIGPEMVTVMAAACRVVAESAPEYLPWIRRVLRGVALCMKDDRDVVVSGSSEVCPGIVHVSYPQTPIEIAELLVHEAAHQYFYIAELVGPVDDGSDQRLYWSPPMNMERPLSRILIAYHALANVLLFYGLVRSLDITDEYVERNLPPMYEAVSQLDAPLRRTSALSTIGIGLYEPLAERLGALAE